MLIPDVFCASIILSFEDKCQHIIVVVSGMALAFVSANCEIVYHYNNWLTSRVQKVAVEG